MEWAESAEEEPSHNPHLGPWSRGSHTAARRAAGAPAGAEKGPGGRAAGSAAPEAACWGRPVALMPPFDTTTDRTGSAAAPEVRSRGVV